jgi:hypothetical protein
MNVLHTVLLRTTSIAFAKLVKTSVCIPVYLYVFQCMYSLVIICQLLRVVLLSNKKSRDCLLSVLLKQ